MENKSETKTQKQKTARWSFQKVLEFCAYIAIGCIAIALVFAAIFKGKNGGNITAVFNNIGQCIAYILSIILAAYWVKRKKHIAWLCCYIVFVVVIIVMYIINLI